MAVIIDVSITFASIESDALPEARFWVDVDLERGLQSEVEVPLKREGKGGFRGTLALENGTDQLIYRLGVCAHPGAVWSLTISRRHPSATVLSDTDALGSSKAWLTGSCAIPSASSLRRRCVGSPHATELITPLSSSRPPYLLLLDR